MVLLFRKHLRLKIDYNMFNLLIRRKKEKEHFTMETTKKPQPINPNLEAKELIDPMIFEREDGTPLVNPFVYYDRKLDYEQPLPPITPLGIEYFTNWKKVGQTTGSPVFPLDYLKNIQSNHNTESIYPKDDRKEESTKNNKKQIDVNSKDRSSEPKVETVCYEEKANAYYIMKRLLSCENIILINETFYVYSGTSYEPKTPKDMARLVLKRCRELIKNKSSGFVDGVVNFLRMEPKILVLQSQIPQRYIAFKNGVLDVITGQFMTHSPNYLTLFEVQANYSYSTDTPTPIFDKYLFTITGGDAILAERILQAIGYILSPNNNGKCFFLLQGVPNSGKSVFANFLQKLFSHNAVIQLESHLFGEKFTASEIIGKALCSFPDIPASPLNDATVSRLKLYTGNDPISAPIRYKENEKFICTAKFIFATNHAFLTRSEDQAFNNRIVTIPFKYSIPKSEQIFDIEGALFSERDGIVSKAIAAYFRLADNDYNFAGDYAPNEIVALVDSEEIDCRIHLFEFTKNNFVAVENAVVFTDDAYQLFGTRLTGMSKNDFSHYFQKFAFDIFNAKKDRKRKPGATNPTSCLVGIAFKPEV